MAMPTIESAVGASESSYTCHAIATRKMPSPRRDTTMPVQRRRKIA